VWYPVVFWVINTGATVGGFVRALSMRHGQRARWISPDRGAHFDVEADRIAAAKVAPPGVSPDV
jgi:hypothetical protein